MVKPRNIAGIKEEKEDKEEDSNTENGSQSPRLWQKTCQQATEALEEIQEEGKTEIADEGNPTLTHTKDNSYNPGNSRGSLPQFAVLTSVQPEGEGILLHAFVSCIRCTMKTKSQHHKQSVKVHESKHGQKLN